MTAGGDVWVSIYTCRTRQEAGLAVAKLQSLGFDARVDGQEASIYGESWFGNVSPLNPKIQVLQRDAEGARAVLDAVDRRRVERMTSIPCPKCGQRDPDRVWPQPRLIAIAVAILLFVAMSTGQMWMAIPLFVAACAIVWPYTPRWRCKACGERWIAPDPDSVVDDVEDSAEEENDKEDESA